MYDGTIVDIGTSNVISWEQHKTFFFTYFHVVQVKPLTKNFGKVLNFFYNCIICFVSAIRCDIISVTMV